MMTMRRRRSFSPEFKAQTVELVRTSGKSVAEMCRDLDLTETAVRRWVAQAEIDAGQRDGLTTAEREELSRLQHSVAQLCRVLQVASSGYYAWRHRRPSRRAQANVMLMHQIGQFTRAADTHTARHGSRPTTSAPPASASLA